MARENEVDFRVHYAGWGSQAITPSDTTVLSPICRKLWVGGAGTVALRMLDGSTATLLLVPVGMLDGLQFDQVRAATTATSLIAFS